MMIAHFQNLLTGFFLLHPSNWLPSYLFFEDYGHFFSWVSCVYFTKFAKHQYIVFDSLIQQINRVTRGLFITILDFLKKSCFNLTRATYAFFKKNTLLIQQIEVEVLILLFLINLCSKEDFFF